MTKCDRQEDVVEGASKMVESEPTTESATDRKLKFIARLNEVIIAFNSDSDFLDGLWSGF